jgi:hypothetical protein
MTTKKRESTQSDQYRLFADSMMIGGPLHQLCEAWLRRTRPLWKPALLAALILLPLESTAAVYKCKGADGSTVFADAPCGPDAQVLVVRTPPPISDMPVSTKGIGGRSTQRDESVVHPAQSAKLPQMSLARPVAAGAVGGFDGYLSDAHLLESRQSAAPGVVIRYSDPVNGALLKSVLNPVRASSMLDAAMRQHNTRQFDELRHLVEPMQQRYALAFASNPRAYEPEYLDTMDIGAVVVRHAIDQMRTASQTPPPTPAASAKAADAKLSQSLASLNQSMNGLMTTMAQAMATGIRQQVIGGKFSPAGAQRATGIANSLASESP